MHVEHGILMKQSSDLVTPSGNSAREALNAHPDWAQVMLRLGFLLIFTFISTWLATRAFRAYQRTA